MPGLLSKQIGPYGLGLMSMTWRPNQTPDNQAFAAMKAALEAGANLWNGGEFYGPRTSSSLHLLNRYFTSYPADADKVILNIKGGNDEALNPHGDEAFVRASVENCVKILDGKKKIDIFECARVDPTVPIEATIGTLAKLVQEGKIGGIGLSECNAQTIKRAVKVHPITSVEVELSLWETNCLKNGVADTCAELGIPIIAYAPLGQGFLTGQIKRPDDIPEGDFRRQFPRFFPENFAKNVQLVDHLKLIAKKKGCTPAQLALAWVKQLGQEKGMPIIIPLPGATTAARVVENMELISLSPSELEEINKVVRSFKVSGERYPDFLQDQLEG